MPGQKKIDFCYVGYIRLSSALAKTICRNQNQDNKTYFILQNKGIVSLDKLAHFANMSFRNFERRFIEEVGMSPKLYARIIRFYNAVENKMRHPEKSWTEITYEGGYFDQAHFIKEVKTFSAKTPDELFKYTPPPVEKFIERVEH